MQISDVEQLRAAQARIRQMVPGFRFNLGFSGRHFHRGYPAENRGEDLLLCKFQPFPYQKPFHINVSSNIIL